jgi:hypothetical protein
MQQQVPVTTTRMQSEIVQQQTPITTTRYENQVVAQQVPVQVQKMVPVQEKVMVPQTVQKPMTKRIAKEKTEYVTEQVVRPVTVQKEVYKDEVVIEETPIQTTRMERVVQKVSVPQKVYKTVPVTEIRLVPRTVVRRIPIDANGNPIVVQSLSAPATSTISSPSDLPAASETKSNLDAASEGTTVTAKKPSLSESGDLPAPSAPSAPLVPTEPAAEASSNTELKIGNPDPNPEPTVKAEPTNTTPSSEKSGKIKVTGDE